jgi:hypothetical protein
MLWYVGNLHAKANWCPARTILIQNSYDKSLSVACWSYSKHNINCDVWTNSTSRLLACQYVIYDDWSMPFLMHLYSLTYIYYFQNLQSDGWKHILVWVSWIAKPNKIGALWRIWHWWIALHPRYMTLICYRIWTPQVSVTHHIYISKKCHTTD